MDPRNDMSYWWPRVKDCGVPMPATELVFASDEEVRLLHQVIDGEVRRSSLTLREFGHRLDEAALEVMNDHGAVFLRGGHQAAKHEYRRTCFVPNISKILDHALAIAEHGEMISIIGFPLGTWAVREMLPVLALFHAFGSAMFPVSREFRFFAEDGKVLGWQPYWPEESIMAVADAMTEEWKPRLAEASEMTDSEHADLSAMAVTVSRAVGSDAWSIDFLQDRTGKWWMTDMALMADSFVARDAVWEAKKGGG